MQNNLLTRVIRRPNAKIEKFPELATIKVWSYSSLVVKITWDVSKPELFQLPGKYKTVTVLYPHYRSKTTKKLINEMATIYELPYHVYQRGNIWYCDININGNNYTHNFEENDVCYITNES